MEYQVNWFVNLDADDPRQAAVLARQMIQDPESIATLYQVTNEETNEMTVVDLGEVDR
jgi:hypothetical protein